MKFGDYLNNLAVKSGIASTDADLIAMLSSPTLSNSEIPDSLVAKFDTALMTVEAAKNNPAVLAAVRAQVYNGVDSELNRSYEELGLDEPTKQELLLEKNTNKRVTASLKKIAELEKAKAGASKGDKTALDAEINRLNGELKTIKTEYTDKIKAINEEHESALLNYDLNSSLSGYNYAFPKEMDKGVVTETVKNVINQSLKAKDAKLIRENGALKLVKASTGLEYFNEKNEKVDAKGFIESTLAQNKLLAVNGTTTTPVTTTTTTIQDDKPTRNNRNFNELVEKSLADMKAGSTEVAV